MKLIQRNRDAAYLQYDKYVDFDNPMVMEKAMDLTKNCRSVYEKIETIYYFVRDEIDHTWDAKDSTITISASDVLEKKTGISYSKANLLAALMRAMVFTPDSATRGSNGSHMITSWHFMH